ncbi:hypothetical protein [Sphingomonas sp. 32-62-10]
MIRLSIPVEASTALLASIGVRDMPARCSTVCLAALAHEQLARRS